jgi:group I intron endonuclease
MINAHIYLVTNAVNRKQYIGQTTVARNKVGHGELIKLAYYKYGKENFIYEPICNGIVSRSSLNAIERFWIKVIGCQSPKGYNIEEGGSSKGDVAESTRKKLSIINKGKVIPKHVREKISNSLKGANNPFYGKTHTPESIQKIIAANVGKTVIITEEQKRKISLANSGVRNGMYGKPITDEHRAKLKVNSARNKYWLGKKFTETQKAHLSMVKVCPHCSKVGKGNAMVRWHMEKCKLKVVL